MPSISYFQRSLVFVSLHFNMVTKRNKENDTEDSLPPAKRQKQAQDEESSGSTPPRRASRASTNEAGHIPRLPRDHDAEARPLFSPESFPFASGRPNELVGCRHAALVARPLAPSTLGVTTVPPPSQPTRGFIETRTTPVAATNQESPVVVETVHHDNDEEQEEDGSPDSNQEPQHKRPKVEGWGDTLLADLTKGKWRCKTCAVFNDESKSQCQSCEAIRPGTSGDGSSGNAASAGADGASGSSSIGSGGFSFGNTSGGDASSGGATGFSFGVPPTATATPPPFSFGFRAVPNTEPFSFGNATATSNGARSGFTFGSTAANQDSTPPTAFSFGFGATAPTAFPFGGGSGTAASTAPTAPTPASSTGRGANDKTLPHRRLVVEHLLARALLL